MKKILTIITLAIMLTVGNVCAEEVNNDVILYMFRGTGCGGCAAALEEINSFEGKYDEDFTLVTIDVWSGNEDNGELFAVLNSEFEGSGAIPFFIIGDSFSSEGFNDEVLEEALNAKTDPDYIDHVGDTMKEQGGSYELTNLEEAARDEGFTYWEAGGSHDGLIVLGIFVVVIGGIVALIALPNRKKSK